VFEAAAAPRRHDLENQHYANNPSPRPHAQTCTNTFERRSQHRPTLSRPPHTYSTVTVYQSAVHIDLGSSGPAPTRSLRRLAPSPSIPPLATTPHPHLPVLKAVSRVESNDRASEVRKPRYQRAAHNAFPRHLHPMRASPLPHIRALMLQVQRMNLGASAWCANCAHASGGSARLNAPRHPPSPLRTSSYVWSGLPV
jgi:hypothetical protein